MVNNKFTFGAILSPIDIRDYKGVACATQIEYPAEFELEMPEVKHQGSVGSCVAHAISTVVEYHSRLYEDEMKPMSVGYIYGNRKNTHHNGIGMVTRDAIQATCEYGDVVNNLFPYNEEVPGIIERFNNSVSSLIAKSIPNKFTEFYLLNSKADIKASLMKNGPVIMAMNWWDDIYINKDNIMQTKCESSKSAHCMVIYGWNKIGWKVQNSWGTNWGDKGRCIIPYDVKIYEFWGVVDNYSENRSKRQIEALNKQVLDLNEIIDDLKSQNIKLSNTIEELSQLSNITEEQQKQIDLYLIEINDLNKQLLDQQVILEQKLKEIDLLNSKLLDIEKPYKGKVAQFFAKIINFIINAFLKFKSFLKGKFKR